MCTSLAMKTKDFYFGRNMDIEYHFNEEVIITPRNYEFCFPSKGKISKRYAIIGMGTIIDDYPLYADACNEKGLCMAGLNFPSFACYSLEEVKGKDNISPYELINWILCQCKSIFEVKELLSKLNLVNRPFKESIPLATLHWHIADQNQSIVLEYTKTGLNLYDNPVNVLTNNPNFDFHLLNLSQYLNLNTSNPKNFLFEERGIKLISKGIGSVGLPGDCSSISRFVRLVYFQLNSNCLKDNLSSITHFFHLLDTVKVVDGAIKIAEARSYKTIYSSCINATKGCYYYKTYENSQIVCINMYQRNLDTDKLSFALLKTKQNILND